MRGSLTCQATGCRRHPERGDTIIRVSPKGEPFLGLCTEHYRLGLDILMGDAPNPLVPKEDQ